MRTQARSATSERRNEASQPADRPVPNYRPVTTLDPETRQIIEETALEEIEHFAAWGDPLAIERLAEAGRCAEWSSDEGTAMAWQVSEVMDEIARKLRAGRTELTGAMVALGPLVRLSAARWR